MQSKVILLSVVLSLFLVSCGGDFFMVKQEQKPEIKADPDKATLVIYRGTSYGYAVKIDNFIDKKFIGQTKGKCFFVTKVDPGSHYLIGASENNSCAKVNLEAGKIYYVLQGIYPGVMYARTGFSGSNPEDFSKDLEDMDFFVYSSSEEPPVIEDEDYNETIADFEKENQEDPSKHKDMTELKGF